MPTNDGVIFSGKRDVAYIELYYDKTFLPAGPDQPIIDVNGAALRAVNLTSQDISVEIAGPAGKLLGADGQSVLPMPPGVTTYTAQQLARPQVRIQTRGDVAFRVVV